MSRKQERINEGKNTPNPKLPMVKGSAVGAPVLSKTLSPLSANHLIAVGVEW